MNEIERGTFRHLMGEPPWDGQLWPIAVGESGADADDESRSVNDEPPNTDDWPLPAGPLPAMRMVQSAYGNAMRELTRRQPEYAGMLLGPKESDVITHFVADKNGQATSASFTLDAGWLNRVLRQFQRCGMNAKGLIHSHPAGVTRPSGGDLHYVGRALANPKNKECTEFFLPIVCDGRLYPYVITREQSRRVLRAELVLL